MNDKEKLEAILDIAIAFHTGKAIKVSGDESWTPTLQFMKAFENVIQIIKS